MTPRALLILERHDAALTHIDRALKMSRAPTYLLTRCRILIAMERNEEAAHLLHILQREFPRAPEAVTAAEMLEALSG